MNDDRRAGAAFSAIVFVMLRAEFWDQRQTVLAPVQTRRA